MRATIGRMLISAALVLPLSAAGVAPTQANAPIMVTSKFACGGTGSFSAAIAQANAQAGPDVIEFQPGLQVDAASCGLPSGYDPSGQFIATVTESLTIHGNGAVVDGYNFFTTPSGIGVNWEDGCPKTNKSYIVAVASKGLIQVGSYGADNKGVDVTIDNLTLKRTNAIARVELGAGLTLVDFTADEIASMVRCNTPAIEGDGSGASLTLVRNTWTRIWHWSYPIAPLAYEPAISGGSRSGKLSILDSTFDFVGRGGFIQWAGDVDIESTVMHNTGGISNYAGKRVRVANSLWAMESLGGMGVADHFINGTGGQMRFEATTLLLPSTDPEMCGKPCANPPFIWNRGGSVSFFSSAIAVNFAEGAAPILGSSDPNAASGFSADDATWISPVDAQNGAALRAITGQPLLRVAKPGLPLQVPPSLLGRRATPLLGTAEAPGQLIETVSRAACGRANELIGPVSGACIEKDVFGNPRVDLGTGTRDTGAVQASATAALSVTGTGDRSISLQWTRPRLPADRVIVGYAVLYREFGTSDPYARLEVGATPRSATLTPPDAPVVNGTRYEIVVVARTCPANAPACGDPTDGAPGNEVKATPYGPIGTPVVGATPGDAYVDLTWTKPEAGGHTIGSYSILWRPVGAQQWAGAKAINDGDTLAATISGLTNDLEYEFRVTAQATNGDDGPGGTTTATPTGPTDPVEPPAIELAMTRDWSARYYPPRIGAAVEDELTITPVSGRVEGPVDVKDLDLEVTVCPSVDTIGNEDGFLDPGEELVCTGVHRVTRADIARGFIETTAYALRGPDRLEDVDVTATITVAPTYLVILDRSGSEATTRTSTVRRLNADVRRWTARFAGSPFYLALFSTWGTDHRFRGLAVGKVPRLRAGLIDAQGDSNIYDAVAKEIRLRHRTMTPQRVRVIIATDGRDNASTQETERSLARLIRVMEANFGWRFSYDGARLASLAEAVDALGDWTPTAAEARELLATTP